MKVNKETLKTVVSVVSTANTLRIMYSDYRTGWKESREYTATVPQDSYVFDELLEWLNDKCVNTRRVKFTSRHGGIKKHYDSNAVSYLNLDGHKVSVTISKPEQSGSQYDANDMIMPYYTKDMIFTSATKAGIDAVYRLLEELHESMKLKEKKAHVYSINQYGWNGRPLRERPLDSVVLPEGVQESVVHDLEQFLDSEESYNRMGVPWHRGYLFYGPPGNGKSSIATALASKYKLNLYNLPLGSIKDDAELNHKIVDINSESILLLEDIDVFSNTIGREQAETGPTLAGLLNALDGVSTPHGLITIMTTNNIDALDSALIRPGRIDFKLELSKPNDHQIEQMFYNIYDEELGVEPKTFESMAQLADVFKRHALDIEAARLEIKL